jgi:hypothetical protein
VKFKVTFHGFGYGQNGNFLRYGKFKPLIDSGGCCLAQALSSSKESDCASADLIACFSKKNDGLAFWPVASISRPLSF